MALKHRLNEDDQHATPAFPWWVVVGRLWDGTLISDRVSSSSVQMAKVEFERKHSGVLVVSVAKELYRNED